MKVGDIVKVKVPMPGIEPGTSRYHNISGIIIGQLQRKQVGVKGLVHPKGTWWEVLCTDTGSIEKFHENWCEVISEIS